jgi:hypothetical protein
MSSNKSCQNIECCDNILGLITNIDSILSELLQQSQHICLHCSKKIEELYFKNRIEEDKEMDRALEDGEITQIDYDNWETIRVKDDSMFVRSLYNE